MADRSSHSAADRVISLVQKLLTQRSISRAIHPADDLRDAGLTSMDMVNLVLAVESEFVMSKRCGGGVTCQPVGASCTFICKALSAALTCSGSMHVPRSRASCVRRKLTAARFTWCTLD